MLYNVVLRFFLSIGVCFKLIADFSVLSMYFQKYLSKIFKGPSFVMVDPGPGICCMEVFSHFRKGLYEKSTHPVDLLPFSLFCLNVNRLDRRYK